MTSPHPLLTCNHLITYVTTRQNLDEAVKHLHKVSKKAMKMKKYALDKHAEYSAVYYHKLRDSCETPLTLDELCTFSKKLTEECDAVEKACSDILKENYDNLKAAEKLWKRAQKEHIKARNNMVIKYGVDSIDSIYITPKPTSLINNW